MIKKKEKRITNSELLDSINISFSKVEEKMATKDDLKNLETKMANKDDVEELKNKLEGINNRKDDMSLNRVKYEDHDKLKMRMDFIEKKLEIKK